MKRITIADLEQRISYLNDLIGREENEVGSFQLSGAYGGWKFVELVNEAGGIRNTIGMGYESKRECYNRLNAFMSGIESQHSKWRA